MQTSLAKKIFAVGASGAMLLAAAPFVASAQVHSAGTNVLSNGTIYFINASGQKQPYTSAGAFLSYGFNSWSNVVAASAEDIALPQGSFVPPADGSVINDKGTIYVITNGQRAGIANPSAFLGLGYTWSQAMSGDTSFLTTLPAINSASQAHLAGSLINQNNTVYLVGPNGKLGIPTPAVFSSWGYSWNNVVLANSYDMSLPTVSTVMPTMQMGYLNPLAQLGVSSGTTTVPPVTGSVSVSLASDTPVNGQTIIAGQAAAPLASFVFNGTGTVTGLTFTRIGISNNNAIDNVYLYQGSTRLTGGSSVTSAGTVTFSNASGLFTVNGPTEITVRADLDATQVNGVYTNISAGQTIGLQLTSGLTGTTSVAGAPVSGNLSSVATASNLATVTIAPNGVNSVTPSNANNANNTVNAGTTNFVLWSAPVQISQRAVSLSSANFSYLGSAQSNAFANWSLYLDGAKVATSTGINSNNYVSFTPTAAVTLTTGSHVLEVHVDIIGGSSRSAELSLQNASDLFLIDTNYNVGVTPYVASTGTFQPVTAGSVTIQQGSLSISQDPAFSAVTTVPAGAAGQTIASYSVQSYGENVKINNLTVNLLETSPVYSAGSTTYGLQNVSVYLNGAQVGNTQNATLTYNANTNSNVAQNIPAGTAQGTATATGTASFNFGSQLVIPFGSTPSILQIKADLQNSSGANLNSGTVEADLAAGTSNAQGMSSSQVTGTSAAAGQSLTVGGILQSLSLNSTLAASGTTVLANTTGQLIGSYVIQAGSSEGINLNSVTVGLPTLTGSFSAQNNVIQNLNNLKLTISNCSGQTYTATPVNPQTTNTFSVACSIALNSSATVNVYADPGTVSTVSTVGTNLYILGQGQSSHNSFNTEISNTPLAGQVVTVNNGGVSEYPTLGASALVSSLVASAQPTGTTTSTTGTQGAASTAAFNFVSTVGTSTINEVWVSVYKPGVVPTTVSLGANLISSGTAPVSQITVSGPGLNGTTSTSSAQVVGGIAHITGLAIQVAQGNAGQDISVTPTYNYVGSNGLLPTGTGVVFGLNEYKYQAGSKTIDQPILATSTPLSNTMVIVGSYPTVTPVSGFVGASSGAAFGAGQQVLQFTVTAPTSGPVRIKQIGITPNFSENLGTSGSAGSADTFAQGSNNVIFKVYNVTNSSQILNSPTTGSSAGELVAAGDVVSGTQIALTFATPEVISAGGSKTYAITVDTTGLKNNGDSFRLDLTNTGESYLGPTSLVTVAAPYTNGGTGQSTNWAWNDASVALQGGTSETFLNGYLVQQLPITGPTFVK